MPYPPLDRRWDPKEKHFQRATTIAAVRGLEATSLAFRSKLRDVAVQVGVHPDDLAAVISFETEGTFDPTIRNPSTGAVGLIQWTEDGAQDVHGMSREQIAQLDAFDQLDLVAGWFEHVNAWKGRTVCESVMGCRPENTYMVVFAPKFVGFPSNAVIYEEGTAAYEHNAALDRDDDGKITKEEAASGVVAILREARKRNRLAAIQHPIWPALALGALTGAVIWWRRSP